MTEQRVPTDKEFDAIERLATELQKAKLVEATAKQARVSIEAKLDCLIPCSEEGQRTITLSDKRKVVVERGLIYTAEIDKITKLDIFKQLGVAAPVGTKVTRTLDIAGYKWFREFQPTAWTKIATYVEIKPKKTAVTVKAAPVARKAKAKK